LNISTVYASTGSGYLAASASAKAGVEVLTKSLAAEQNLSRISYWIKG